MINGWIASKYYCVWSALCQFTLKHKKIMIKMEARNKVAMNF
jgi:hypothetical protein